MDTNTPEDEPDIPHLRFLRTLVTVLAGVMILGLLVLIVLIVIRFRHDSAPLPILPAAITLPAGETAQSLSAGDGWFLVLTETGRALIYLPDGTLHSTTMIALPD